MRIAFNIKSHQYNQSLLLQLTIFKRLKMSIIKDFKEFAVKGNVIDMAVGIIIGAAFGKIITSIVSDVMMPPIGMMINGVDFKDLSYIIKEAVVGPDKTTIITPAVIISYGKFIQTVIDFTIVAFAVFTLVRILTSMKRKQEEVAAPAPAAPSNQEVLLTEIRDLLKNKK